jgi:hypothetical protein
MLVLDDQWLRINDEFDSDGNRTVPVFGRMVRQNGMVIGRVVRTNDKFLAQKYRFGNFLDRGEFGSIGEAFHMLEGLTT